MKRPKKLTPGKTLVTLEDLAKYHARHVVPLIRAVAASNTQEDKDAAELATRVLQEASNATP